MINGVARRQLCRSRSQSAISGALRSGAVEHRVVTPGNSGRSPECNVKCIASRSSSAPRPNGWCRPGRYRPLRYRREVRPRLRRGRHPSTGRYAPRAGTRDGGPLGGLRRALVRRLGRPGRRRCKLGRRRAARRAEMLEARIAVQLLLRPAPSGQRLGMRPALIRSRRA